MVQPFKARIKTPVRMINLKPQKMPEKIKRIRRRANKNNTKDKMIALLPLNVMPLKPQLSSIKKRNIATTKGLEKIFLKLPTITIIRRAIILGIISSYKTSCSLDNFHINDCKYGG